MFTSRWPVLVVAWMLATAAGLPLSAQEAPPAAPPAAPPDAPADKPGEQTPAALWEDFNHYLRVRSLDLAVGYGQALLKLQDIPLLEVIEASRHARTYEATLDEGRKLAKVKDVAEQLAAKIQKARISRARDKERIKADIAQLAQGQRPFEAALERLQVAGQFAAPQLLATLVDDAQTPLMPYVLRAMAAIGRPMVQPLATALPHLDARPMGQVAQVLAEIGYPRALPAMKMVLERGNVDAGAKARVQRAYGELAKAASVAPDTAAATLWLEMATNFYNVGAGKPAELPGFDPVTGQGVLWEYTREHGLVWSQVPGAIFGDVLALRAARQALHLKPDYDLALSLWLTANLRRETRLAGQPDPTYHGKHPAGFFIRVAGPARAHDVLDRALADQDTLLAVKAIDILAETAGTEVLVNKQGLTQPLIQALYYPDRRVRFAAAFAMTNSRPQAEFPGSFRVVPLLCDAVRQSAVKYAMVLAADAKQRNELAGVLAKDLGYQVDAAGTLGDLAEAMRGRPGVDVLVLAGSADGVALTVRRAAEDPRLAVAPMVAVVSVADAQDLAERFVSDRHRPLPISGSDAAALKAAIEQVSKGFVGAAITEEEATAFALKALALLREIALTRGEVFRIAQARPTLVAALKDARPEVAKRAAGVLALIGEPEAQQALATEALDAARPEDVRVALLAGLAESARYYGHQLTQEQTDKVLALVKESSGDLALAASKAHGALMLPTRNVLKLMPQ